MKKHQTDMLLVALLLCALAYLYYANGALRYTCDALAVQAQGEGAMICITTIKDRELRERDTKKMTELEAKLEATMREHNQTPSNGPAILLRSPAASP